MEKIKFTQEEVKNKQAEFDQTLALTLEAYIGFNDILEHGALADKLFVIKQMEMMQQAFKIYHDEYFKHSLLSPSQIKEYVQGSETKWIQKIQKKAEEIKAQITKASKLIEKYCPINKKVKGSVTKRNRMKKNSKRKMMD